MLRRCLSVCRRCGRLMPQGNKPSATIKRLPCVISLSSANCWHMICHMQCMLPCRRHRLAPDQRCCGWCQMLLRYFASLLGNTAAACYLTTERLTQPSLPIPTNDHWLALPALGKCHRQTAQLVFARQGPTSTLNAQQRFQLHLRNCCALAAVQLPAQVLGLQEVGGNAQRAQVLEQHCRLHSNCLCNHSLCSQVQPSIAPQQVTLQASRHAQQSTLYSVADLAC